ncbi:Planctomycete cytochrome C [Roseimaritima multifibrata]|uniref:Planctomycete cytochrome C n=1 Tax=Roseimaritima multifibrata TaxID=1930274 RepID=A0A517MAC2_9BACT|nr:DUF1553 domain-containing protein [Roseimaritima multifibrata]QDS91840.1 Planctomycete cytochrome C [Roseimaritima multifibrata]
MGRWIYLTALLTIVGWSPAWGADPAADSDAGQALFEKQIAPALAKHCYECHAKDAEDIAVGLELDSPTGMMRGGDSGPVIIPHDPDKSLLLQMIRQDEDVSPMPPDEKLSDETIAAFTEWIRLGAPDTRRDDGPTAKEERLAEGRKHWSFQTPLRAEPPTVKNADWPRTAIDKWTLAKMESEGVHPVEDANRQTLVRRMTFDLVGLPPLPEQIQRFATGDNPEPIATLVDELLQSPQFGERWGRHWLDIVRFAESSGMEFNFTYPHAWPYRNYVIDSFNRDKPYDTFLIEQIAGDLIPPTGNESEELLTERQIASSILSFGPKRHNSSGTGFRMDIVDDQIDTVFRATQAMTVACARCHDHKFDPIPTTDYYALAGIFLSTEPLYGTIKQKYSNNPTDLIPIGENGKAKHAAAEKHAAALAELQKSLATKKAERTKATEAEKVASEKQATADKLVKTETSTLETGPTAEATKGLEEATAAFQTAKANAAKLKEETAAIEKQIAENKANKPPRPAYAMSARDRSKPADTKVAIRGNYRDQGESVPRNFLTAIPHLASLDIPPEHSGRLEMAKAIASPKNPLTARVMVNRTWHHLLGRGLVSSVDNFGLIGQTPVNQELLDHLALEFMENGWSVKQIIRSIMLSRTYQLSSYKDPDNVQIDPINKTYWRATPRRLEAEVIRDAILQVSGELKNDRPAGSTVTGLGDQMVRGIPTAKIQPDSQHRSVYLPVVRDYVPEIFDLFDFPSPSLVSGKRSVTNVPAQALYLRNSPFVNQQSQAAAKRLLATSNVSDDAQRVRLAMLWSLGREPHPQEATAALALVNQIRTAAQEDTESDAENTAWAAWFQTLFTTAEFRYLVDIH